MMKTIPTGGLNAPSLCTMVKASRIQWIQRYNGPSNHLWKNIFAMFLKELNLDISLLLRANYKLDREQRSRLPEFYCEVLDLWSAYGETKPDSKVNMLWYNDCIRIAGKPVCYSEFKRIGINYIRDLYDNSNTPLPFVHWKNRGLSQGHFIKWYGLINVVQKLTRPTDAGNNDCLTDNDDTEISDSAYIVNLGNKIKSLAKVKTKDIYHIILSGVIGKEVVPPKIAHEFVEVGDTCDWGKIYVRAYWNCVDTKGREFQYKVLNNFVATNYWLYKWKIKDSDKCTLCNSETETVCHLFWECSETQDLWTRIVEWYNSKINDTVIIDKRIAILGSDDKLLHTITVLAKEYIFRSKLADQELSFNAFQNLVNHVKKLELQSGQPHLLEKWTPIEI